VEGTKGWEKSLCCVSGSVIEKWNSEIETPKYREDCKVGIICTWEIQLFIGKQYYITTID
jgi:hypothetical protein